MLKKRDTETMFKSPLSKSYWQLAVSECKDIRMLAIAALIVALRVALNPVSVPILGAQLKIHFSFWVNALGAMIYGPVMALLTGAVSDTLSCILFPSGAPYFFPFIFVEMLGGFVFALFLYRAQLSNLRIILSRFAVVVSCNFILNPLIMVVYYQLYYKSSAYTIVSVSATVIKNIAMFPLEALVLILFLSAMIPALKSLRLVSRGQERLILKSSTYIMLAVLAALSVVFLFCFVEFDLLNTVKDFARSLL